MRFEIVMPKMGESVTEGTIIKWHKKPGDPVKKDEIIFEISTDKVDTEIPSQAEGFLTEVLYKEGDTIEVGKVVAVIDSASSGTAPAHAPALPNVEPEGASAPPASRQSAPAPAPSTGDALLEITMPKMGESVMEGTIIKWHKKVGDAVKKDETIFEISTDKVDTEVPAPAEGVLAEVLVKEQETVGVGVVVGRLAAHGVHIPKAPAAGPAPAMHDVIAAAAAAAVVPPPAPVHAPAAPASVPAPSAADNRFYSPLVLNIARVEQVGFDELARIPGTGAGGRVSKKDILAYIENRKKGLVAPPAPVPVQATPAAAPAPLPAAAAPAYTVQQAAEQFVAAGGIDRIPMDNIRQRIMQHMVKSRDTSVHVTALIEVDMSRVYNFIRKKKEHYLAAEGVKLTYMPFIAAAAVKALKENPLVNASIEGSSILQKRFINLGIAVALEPNGLIVPNIKNAQDKNVLGMARAISSIAEKARNKKLTPDDISGGTFTITNYGVFGTLFGTPIINQPEVAILGVGAVVKKPVVVELDGTDTIAIKPMLYVTLAHDHRLVDGMLGGRFLKSLKDSLENFSEQAMA